MLEYYQKYEPIFGAWKIKRLLGEGRFGKVYEIEREDFGTIYKAALKAITIPQNQAELNSMTDGMDMGNAKEYIHQFVKDIVGEFELMAKLKGNSNVVSYEDHMVIAHQDGIGWDILIRMELLTPLTDYLKENALSKRDVIKLGIDICRALELCQKFNIIHRDIKPENIFVSANGDFKLGDFGIARQIEKTTSGLSKKGTYTYMAPEVYKGEAYGTSVDIYSLGIVLYRLLNHNRAPFLPPYPNKVKHSDQEQALVRRMSGDPLPIPVGVSEGRVVEIMLMACHYNPEHRYSSPLQMREELEAIMYTEGEGLLMNPSGDSVPIKSMEYATGGQSVNQPYASGDGTVVMGNDDTVVMTGVQAPYTAKEKKKIKTPIIVAASVVALSLVIGLFAWQAGNPANIPVSSITGMADIISIEVDESIPIELTVQPENATDKNIEYEYDKTILDISGDKLIALAEGETDVVIKSGAFTRTLNVSVLPKESETVAVIEEWKNEGYEAEPPYKEYERLYKDGVATEEIRYTGNQKPQEPQNTAQRGDSSPTAKPSSNNSGNSGSSSNNRGSDSSGSNNVVIQQQPTPPPTQQPTPTPTQQPTPTPTTNNDRPPEIYVDFDEY